MVEGPLPETHYRKVPLADLTDPPHGRTVQVIRDYWWRVTEDECLIFYHRGIRGWFGAPQCNPQRAIAEMVGKDLYPWPTEVRLIPLVFIPAPEGN